jgi:hypothetical protein
MSTPHKECLEYVRNTNGGATVDTFVEDWEPMGWRLWDELHALRYVRVDDEKIYLTAKGMNVLHEAT